MYWNDMLDIHVSDVCRWPGAYLCIHVENSRYGYMYWNDMYDIHV